MAHASFGKFRNGKYEWRSLFYKSCRKTALFRFDSDEQDKFCFDSAMVRKGVDE